MPGIVLPTLALMAMGLGGIAALRRCCPWLTPLERLAYGLPLGVIVTSLALLALAPLTGLRAPVVLLASLGSVALAALLWPEKATLRASVRSSQLAARLRTWERDTRLLTRRDPGRILPVVVIGVLALRWAVQWQEAFTYTPTGLFAHQLNVWSDGALHLGDVASFAYGDNFPPQNPRFAGTPYPYHFLADLTAATLVPLGLDPAYALGLHTWLFSLLVALGLFAFARRLTGDRLAATFSVLLVLLGGGLGWLVTLSEINTSHQLGQTLLHRAWDSARQQPGKFRWENQYDSLISIQRGYLYGVPLALLALTLLTQAVERRTWRLFLGAGLVCGLLPFAHQSTLLALALVTPFCVLLFPLRQWLAFFASWVLIAVPQLYVQLGGGRGATAGGRWDVGWVSAPDPWPWFWAKNLGLILPLVLIALFSRSLLPATSRRFLWAFMPLFAAFNLYVFQPWDWDNNKLLFYWFLAAAILIAALLARTWREHRAVVVRFFVALALLSMTLSGLLLNLYQLTSADRYQLLSREEIQLAEQIRAQTPPQAVFAAALQHNHPVHVLGGRRVMTGFNGWLWTQAIDTRQRETDLRAIFTYAPNAPALLRQYRIGYVVIGPAERKDFQANEAAYRDRYPLVIATANYRIYQVDGQASR